jgi:hypothetical protein
MSSPEQLVKELQERLLKKTLQEQQRVAKRVDSYYKLLCNTKRWTAHKSFNKRYISRIFYVTSDMPYITKAVNKFNETSQENKARITLSFESASFCSYIGFCYLELHIEDNNYVLKNENSENNEVKPQENSDEN